jgi:putative sigma-54 modulation protein
MNIQITSRHKKASQSLQDEITAELLNLEKFYDGITSCHVIFDTENSDKTPEIVANLRGKTLSATAKEETMPAVISSCIAKIERQLKKENELVKEHHNKKD